MRPVYSDDYMDRSFDLKRNNCWHLVRDVWRDMTGRDLGDLTPSRTGVGALQGAALQASGGRAFQRLEARVEPCIVLMQRQRDMPHVGVLLRGKVLHMTPRGVRHEALEYATREFPVVEFYVPRAAATEAA
jgi:hypothetical protein